MNTGHFEVKEFDKDNWRRVSIDYIYEFFGNSEAWKHVVFMKDNPGVIDRESPITKFRWISDLA
jgi:hypothetical protein